MQLTPYLAAVAEDLDRATQLTDDTTRDVAQRLVSVLEPGLRLAMVQLLSDAAAQLTAQLNDVVVTVRMDGRDPEWHIAAPEGHGEIAEPAPSDDDENTARVTVRIPEALKRKVDAAAQSAGQSLNTWIVGVLRGATASTHRTTTRTPRRVTGWA